MRVAVVECGSHVGTCPRMEPAWHRLYPPQGQLAGCGADLPGAQKLLLKHPHRLRHASSMPRARSESVAGSGMTDSVPLL